MASFRSYFDTLYLITVGYKHIIINVCGLIQGSLFDQI